MSSLPGTAQGPITGGDAWQVDVTAYFDCSSKKWKAKVTTAVSVYGIGYHLISGVSEASAWAANQTNYCKMMADLAALHYNSNGKQWYMLNAIKVHEDVHVQDWKDFANSEFGPMKSSIEAIEVGHSCGKTASDAATEIKGNPSYTSAVSDAHNATDTAFANTPHASAATDAAEAAVVNPMIAAIQEKATQNSWAPCP